MCISRFGQTSCSLWPQTYFPRIHHGTSSFAKRKIIIFLSLSWHYAGFKYFTLHPLCLSVCFRYTKLRLQVNQDGKIPVKKWETPLPTTFSTLHRVLNASALDVFFFSTSLSLFHFPSCLSQKNSAHFLGFNRVLIQIWITSLVTWTNSLSFSILKLFSDKKRVEAALEQCGLLNNRVIIKYSYWSQGYLKCA